MVWTKDKVIEMMRNNILVYDIDEFKKGYNKAIKDLIEVLEKD